MKFIIVNSSSSKIEKPLELGFSTVTSGHFLPLIIVSLGDIIFLR